MAQAAPAPAPARAVSGLETARVSVSRLPDFICLDIEANKEHCKKIYNKQTTPGLTLDLPGTTVCANKLDTNSPCKSNTCGDGICALGESKSCEDCNIPAVVTLCKCASGSCNLTTVTCSGKICNNSDPVPVNSCQCEADNKVETCSKDDLSCLLEYTAKSCMKKDNNQAADAGFSLQDTWKPKITAPLFDASQFNQ
jgi:hypothetical protein